MHAPPPPPPDEPEAPVCGFDVPPVFPPPEEPEPPVCGFVGFDGVGSGSGL